jgi:hypothetical protein
MFMQFHHQGSNQPKTASPIGKDPHHISATSNLFINAFQQVGRLQMLMMLFGEAIEGQSLFNLLFDPITEFGVFCLPLVQPGGQIPSGFF